MRQLLLLRHAKSTWDDAAMPDRDRPLSARGRRAAAAMRQAMRDLGLAPDVVLVSTARRTMETLEALEPWDDTPLVEPMDSLYLANPVQLAAALHGVPETVRSVLLIGHNPGMHDLALGLTGPRAMQGGGENEHSLAAGFPTGALAEFVVAGSWWDLREGGGRLVRFLTPRMLEGARRILMVLELAADAETVASLSRLKALTACRDGRPRTQPVKIVWHDSPEHALLADGLTLAEQRGVRRLERVYPGADTWLPGQPVPVVAEAPDETALPASLLPLAAFEGRQTISVHRFGDQPVVMTVVKGILRAVTAEQPAARIWLSGEGQAVRAAAVLIAGSVAVAVPLASLSAEAIALATGRPATPRHEGPPALPREGAAAATWVEAPREGPVAPPRGEVLAMPLAGPSALAHGEALAMPLEGPPTRLRDGPVGLLPALPPPRLPGEALSVTGALAHILGHLIDVILANADIVARLEGVGPDPVHQMRVAVRRARSALSIFRGAVPAGALDAIRDHLKELGTRLAPARDWDVFAEETAPAVQRALPDDERLERLVSAASRRRRECRKALAAYLGSAAFRLLGIELAWLVAAGFGSGVVQAVPAEPANPPPSLADFAGDVLRHRWKKLLAAGKRIEELDIPSLHGVRLRAKRARYAAEMFSTLHDGKPLRRFVRRLSVLQQRLGVLNDGAVAVHLLAELGGGSGRHAYATGVVIGFLAARASRIRPRIARAFQRFRRQPAYWA